MGIKKSYSFPGSILPGRDTDLSGNWGSIFELLLTQLSLVDRVILKWAQKWAWAIF